VPSADLNEAKATMGTSERSDDRIKRVQIESKIKQFTSDSIADQARWKSVTGNTMVLSFL